MFDMRFVVRRLTQDTPFVVAHASAREHMIHIVAASGLIQEFVIDHIDFVKEKL